MTSVISGYQYRYRVVGVPVSARTSARLNSPKGNITPLPPTAGF